MALATQQSVQHGRTRLEVELEFVQCLANPFYLNYLAHTKVLDDERFIKYIEYLEYFREPEYSKLLTYPVYSLQALTLLKEPRFRADIANPGLAQEMMQDMVQDMVQSFPPSTSNAPAVTKEVEATTTTTANGTDSQQNGTSSN
ncbi:SOH1-domain-containing protein [Trichophaea hybrida]|nr:SOH1-domain-containing protein [Trichophaea hybrida]